MSASSLPAAAPAVALPPVNPALLNRPWPAAWCRHPHVPPHETAVYLYRRVLDLETRPERFVLHVSADQRYRLYVNGVSVAWGPARGDLFRWHFETVDIAPYLRPGRNVLTAVVTYLDGDLAPQAQVTCEAAFLCQGDTDAEAAVNTPGAWKVTTDNAYSFDLNDARTLQSYFVAGPSERFDAAKHPWGWERPEYDDAGWAAPTLTLRNYAAPHGLADSESHWWLVPRPIPAMEETPQRFARLARAEGVTPLPGWPETPNVTLTIPPHTRAALVLDQGVETTAFPELRISGGAGATLRLAYAEALYDPKASPDWRLQKTDRNAVGDRILRGYADYWTADGGAGRVLRPLWWRTFRYAELTIETEDEPLTVSDLSSVFTAYPFVERARFEAPEAAETGKLIEIGWRTARLCAQETYTDCPYYEQLQYVGDTRIQCFVTYYTSGDHRLWRHAIQQFHDSRIPDGLTRSRHPARVAQVISTFSLWYVCMLHDYWMHVPADDAFLKSLLPGVRGVLEWFRPRLRPDGLLGPLPFWNFTDWAPEWPMGVAPGMKEGGSSIVTLQYALAARAAAQLFTAFGQSTDGHQWLREARRAAQAVRRTCVDDATARVADTPEKKTFSQHAAILAILAGAVPASHATAVLERTLSDPALTQATFYYRFYLNRALVKAGQGDRYLETLEPWREMMRLGLTTWAENPEPTRSDCHAWSSSPNYEFLATVLGVLPDAPGFSRVRVAPHLGTLTQVSGAVPHPRGEVVVDLTRDGGTLVAEVTLPDGVPGVFVWQGNTVELKPGHQSLRLTSKRRR